MKNMRLLLIVMLFFSASAYCQSDNDTKTLTLKEVIALAKEKSNDALQAKSKFDNGYWKYRFFKSDYMPMLGINATLPDFNRSFTKIPIENGSDVFVSRNLINSNVSLGLSQNIGLTGGSIFVNSGLERIDLLGSAPSVSFLATPLQIGMIQPISGFNELRWKKKTEPLKYEESRKQYIEDMENIAIKAADLFFKLYSAQTGFQISLLNQANNDTLYKISEGRYTLGKIAENELLQMELSRLNSNASVEQEKLNVEVRTFELKSFLRITDVSNIRLIPPVDLPDFVPVAEKAISEAKENRAQVISFERMTIEAQQEVARAKSERMNGNLFVSYGLSQNANDFDDVYIKPEDNENLRLGIQIPILDWGRSKAQVKIAQSANQLALAVIEQQRVDFERAIYLKVAQFNMERLQLKNALKADTVAQKRYDVSKERYLIGKIGITDLNIALAEKDNARIAFMNRLHNFWASYYDLRKSTLYDFESGKKIEISE